ncbi:MAG: hypothetical protein WC838_00415 [Candidatus Margulisiibacteriota bacterium]|jgi:hypothetical protein
MSFARKIIDNSDNLLLLRGLAQIRLPIIRDSITELIRNAKDDPENYEIIVMSAPYTEIQLWALAKMQNTKFKNKTAAFLRLAERSALTAEVKKELAAILLKLGIER